MALVTGEVQDGEGLGGTSYQRIEGQVGGGQTEDLELRPARA